MSNLSTFRQNKKAQTNKVTTNATATGSVGIDLSVSQFHKLTLTGNVTFTINNAIASKYNVIVLELLNGGSYTVTWPGSLVWSGGTAPQLNATGTDIIMLISADGTNWKAIRTWRT